MPDEPALWLTGRLLAVFPRFREAGSDREEQNVAEWAGLTRAEVAALQRLRDQVRDADGDPGAALAGFRWHAQNDGGVVRLLTGRYEGLGKTHREAQLWPVVRALREGVGESPVAVAGMTGEVSMETREIPAAAGETTENGAAPTLGVRLEALARARGIDLAEELSAATRAELQSALGVRPQGFGLALAARRKRLTLDARRSTLDGTPAPDRASSPSLSPSSVERRASSAARSPLLAAARAVAEIVLLHGARNVQPPELAEPLAALVRAALAAGE